MIRVLLLAFLAAGVQQDDKILERGERLLEEAKSAYEDAKAKSSAAGFVDAGFKLEEARIKYIVLQEIGAPEKQKLAADRLRAVNQLGKLIHDGKVAISGTPAETDEVKPPSVTPSPTPSPTVEPPKPEPAAPAVDVTKRASMPDPAKQKDTEKAVRDLFKDQYAKKAPVDRKLLVRALLESAAKSQGDLPGLWVLCREAQDIASQVCDVRAIVEAVDTLARSFDVDALAMKNAALITAAKAAKAPEDYAELAAALLQLIEDFVAADQYDAADKAATAALLNARKSNDAGLTQKATTRVREIAEAKTLYTAMKNVLEAIAKNPEDPAANLEMGKFLCFAKGNWDLGLRFVVKGSDASLKALAEKDLASPIQSGDLVAVADGWWDFADKDKSPLRKGQMQAHCKGLYEAALPDAPALVRLRIQKRLDDLEAGQGVAGPVNLLLLVDPQRHQIGGAFQKTAAGLVTPNGAPFARVEVPYQPPPEYDLALTVERRQGSNSFIVGLIADGARFNVMFDAGNLGNASYLDGVGDREGAGQLTRTGGKFLDTGRPAALFISVRKSQLTVTINGVKVVQWKGDYKRLGFDAGWSTPNSNAMILGSWGTEFLISKALLTP